MPIESLADAPRWFWIQKWLDVAKYQNSGKEWSN